MLHTDPVQRRSVNRVSLTDFAVAYPEHSNDDIERDFEVVPITIVRNLKQDELAGSERVHELCKGGGKTYRSI